MVGKYPTSNRNIGKTYNKLEAKVKKEVNLAYYRLSVIKHIQWPTSSPPQYFEFRDQWFLTTKCIEMSPGINEAMTWCVIAWSYRHGETNWRLIWYHWQDAINCKFLLQFTCLITLCKSSPPNLWCKNWMNNSFFILDTNVGCDMLSSGCI
jgi:hypothetical protein